MEINNQQALVTQETTLSTLPRSLAIYGVVELSKTFSQVRTTREAVLINAPTLNTLAVAESKEVIESLIKVHILALDAFLKQKVGLTIDEIELTTDEIMHKYGYFSFADINLIFRNAKVGRYGELYNQLSCRNIIQWFEMYASERAEAAYQINLREDSKRFGRDEANLTKLGYKLDKDGKIIIRKDGRPDLDKDKIQRNNERLKEEERQRKMKLQSKIDSDNGFIKWKEKWLATGEL